MRVWAGGFTVGPSRKDEQSKQAQEGPSGQFQGTLGLVSSPRHLGQDRGAPRWVGAR